jgi:3-deoxy-D-manno-octulosonic-acid transferase
VLDAEGPLYDLAARLAGPLLRLATPASPKLRRGVLGRRAALPHLERWAAASRDPTRPLYWLHAPSVGEALMAQAIITELRALVPDTQVAFTFFSPSAERTADRVGADVTTYLPWDTRANARAALALLRPTAVGFVRTEIWPGLVAEAAAEGVRVCLLNAALTERSSRLRPAAVRLLRRSYARLGAVGAVSEDAARRLPRLGVLPDRIVVTGDARFDQVWSRIGRLDRGAPLLAPFRGGAPIVVAGSTWPADEARLLPALAALRGSRTFQLVIAPHEPSPTHVAALEAALARHGFQSVRLGDLRSGADRQSSEADSAGTGLPPAVIVDRVGVLADLYAVAAVAYVGGGFGRAGLHSVVEPAALGVPVLFGPALGNALEAARLEEAGGGHAVVDAAALEQVLRGWLADPDVRQRTAAAAETFVRQGLGGAAANAALLVPSGAPAGR